MANNKKNRNAVNGANTPELDTDFEEGFDKITMTDEDGNDTEFFVIDEVEDGGNTYLLLAEADSFDEDESEATIFKLTGGSGDDAIYEEIEDDKEFDHVVKLFSGGEDYSIEL